MASAGREAAGAGVALGGVVGVAGAGDAGAAEEGGGAALDRVGLGAEDLDPELLSDGPGVVLTRVGPLLLEGVEAGIVERELDVVVAAGALEEGVED